MEVIPMDEEETIAAIEKALPSVVSIGTVRLVRRSLFEVIPSQGVGSGFILDPDGYILTNNHVVAQTRGIEVVLQDGGRLPGEVVGTDPSSDIAVVKVERRGLPPAELETPISCASARGSSPSAIPWAWPAAPRSPWA